MHKNKITRLLLLLLAAGFIFTSCKKDNDEDENPTPASQVQLNFNFSHRVGSSTLNYDVMGYSNAAGNNYSVITLKYFISDIRLNKADGSSVLIDEEHYVDGTDYNTLLFTPETKVPEGEYSSISFIFGLNEEKNITGAYPNPPESNMEWPVPMGGGYHYMKLEGKLDSAGTIKNYQAHTGATMGTPYYIEVELPSSSFTAADGKIITIGMDINKWWSTPNTLDLNDVSSIMGNPAMQQNLHENGADVFYLESIE
ncbi:MAG: hypothetical protein KQI35_12095 [Bacteroidetes bacterium]|nr:hypothetical protein [Bacteroidota bacterium]